nr:hypothetical protein GCM10020092_027170 [Actinoplanes digitatis]
MLGAEAAPLRGWQQGAALLDWGFALPKDASVGKLVAPEDVAATSTAADGSAAPAAPAQGGKDASAAGTTTDRGLSLGMAAVIAVVLAATPLLLLLTQRRRRRVRSR